MTLSKDARARAVQLPAWNEALGLPRPWDQQWSLRLQQVLAFESDLLEYDDLFAGSHVVEGKVAELVESARAEIDRVQAMGGAIACRRVRLHEAGAGVVPRRPPCPDRVRRGGRGRGEQVRDHRAVAAHRRPRRRDPGRRSRGRAGGDRERPRLEGAARRGRGRRGPGPVGGRCEDRHQPDDRHPRRRAGWCDDGGVGGDPARGVRRVPGTDRGQRRRRRFVSGRCGG